MPLLYPLGFPGKWQCVIVSYHQLNLGLNFIFNIPTYFPWIDLVFLLKSLRSTLLTALKFFSRPINQSLSIKSEFSIFNKCLDAHTDRGSHQIKKNTLHYLYRVEESQWLNFHTFESIWNTTGQYSDIEKHINVEKKHILKSQEKHTLDKTQFAVLWLFFLPQ